jgi:hypothetical protein
MSGPFDPATFSSSNTCLPCCSAPRLCTVFCGLQIPPVDDPAAFPYPDYATAAAAIAAQVSNCIGYVRKIGGGLLTSFVADGSVANELKFTTVGNPDNGAFCQATTWGSINLAAGSTLTINASAVGGLRGATTKLYACVGSEVSPPTVTLLDTQSGATQTFAIATAGEYFIECTVTSNVAGGGSDTMVADATCATILTVNPVIALWNDSGTTRELEACPKLRIPSPAFPGGSWYADHAAAVAAIASYTSNCLGYIENFDASFLPSTLTIAASHTSSYLELIGHEVYPIIAGFQPRGFNLAAALNLVAGQTVNISLNFTSTAPDNPPYNVSYLIVDANTFVVVDSGNVGSGIFQNGNSGNTTSAAMPYRGNFVIWIILNNNFNSSYSQDFTGDFKLTPSGVGTISINPVQAKYATSPLLGCPALLNCS